MKNHKRITLRPAEAAAHLGCSPATLWRWAKTLNQFPEPLKYPGQRITVWFKDELDSWGQTQAKKAGVANLALTYKPSPEQTGTSSHQPYRLILAFLLANGRSLERLAMASGIPIHRLHALAHVGFTKDEDELSRLRAAASAQVKDRLRALASQASKRSGLFADAALWQEVIDLDKAHRLCFSQTLLAHLLSKDQVEGHDHGNT